MKIILHFTLLWCLCSACSTTQYKNPNIITIHGHVESTASYCGGAAPTENILASLRTPRPFVNKKLYIKSDSLNDMHAPILDSVMSDQNGNFQFQLPPGIYCIVDERKATPDFFQMLIKNHSEQTASYSKINQTCLKKWMQKPDAVIVVAQNGTTSITVRYHKPCVWNQIPCISYRGPYPP